MSDAEICFRWLSVPDITRYLGLLIPPATLAHERAWISSVLAKKDQQRVFTIEEQHGRPIGTCGLRGIDRDAGTAFFGIMIGERSLWNQGYGTAATKALLDYAFGELGLREVRLSCHADNRGGIRCYQKAGFQRSRHKPDRAQFGRQDVRMAITRDRWEELRRSADA
jgi:diamine N-acetyltransferase